LSKYTIRSTKSAREILRSIEISLLVYRSVYQRGPFCMSCLASWHFRIGQSYFIFAALAKTYRSLFVSKSESSAWEHIVDIPEKISIITSIERSISKQTQRWPLILGLHPANQENSSHFGNNNRPILQRHRYPGNSENYLKERFYRFQIMLGSNRNFIIYTQ
jgi:hypothetical protein